MELTPAQNQVAMDLHRFRVLNCGRRTGKTILAIEEMIGVAVGHSDARVLYISPTYQSSRDICWEELKKRLKPITIDKNESRLEITVKTAQGGQSLILLRGWEAVETLRGQYFNFVVIDEVASMRNFWMNWHEVLRPALSDKQGGALFCSTPKGYNHFFDLYEMQNKDNDYKSFHFTSYDNPHVPSTEVDKARKELTEDQFAQEYMADFRKMEGLVYKDFHRDLHLYSEADKRNEIVDRLVGIDFGWTNPTAVLLIEKDKDGTYWIADEWYRSEKTMKEITEKLATFEPHAVYADPAEPDRIDELKRARFNIRDVSKDVRAGILSVQELLKQRRLRIHKDCVNTISEMESYRWKELPRSSSTDQLPEVPEKENDHLMDAMRYTLYMNAGLGAKPTRVGYGRSEEDKLFYQAIQRKKQRSTGSTSLKFKI